MPYVYLTHQGAEVVRHSDSLMVKAGDQTLGKLPVHQIDGLCIFGRVHLTLPALELLLGRQIDTSLFTIKGKLKGRVISARPKNVGLRLAQVREGLDPARRIRWARVFVHAKLTNAAEMIQRFAYNHPEADLAGQSGEIKSAAERASEAQDLSQLRGIEGAGTRLYFAAFGRMCLGDLDFGGRTSRPPRDPMNALLSFGYVLLGNELAALLEAAGLEPYLGFYHDAKDGRPSLAVDLIEEFRHPLIDRFCLTLNNRRMIGRDDFDGDPDHGYRLKPDSLKRFLSAYDEWMRSSPQGTRPSPREVIRGQIEALSAALRKGGLYRPYRFES